MMIKVLTFLLLLSAVSGLSMREKFRKRRLQSGGGKKLREKIVATYFEGVHKQDRDVIKACFSPKGTKIRDVCAISNEERVATPFELGERCMEFLAAHPDTKVKFHHPPTCGRGKSRWVYANWYEEGTWKGISRGIPPDGSPLAVEGQTRFYVDDNLKITEMVITRTFSKWEMELQARQAKEDELAKQEELATQDEVTKQDDLATQEDLTKQEELATQEELTKRDE